MEISLTFDAYLLLVYFLQFKYLQTHKKLHLIVKLRHLLTYSEIKKECSFVVYLLIMFKHYSFIPLKE